MKMYSQQKIWEPYKEHLLFRRNVNNTETNLSHSKFDPCKRNRSSKSNINSLSFSFHYPLFN